MSSLDTASEAASDFQRAVSDAVRDALSRDPEGFRGLLGAVAGADPVAVVAAIESLDGRGCQLPPAAREIIREAHTPHATIATVVPVPHPLDYAWMFTSDTDHSLLESIGRSTDAGELVVHLGTPSLHLLAVKELPDRNHILVDRDPRRVATANRLRAASAIELDLLRVRPALKGAAVAIADPPWYPPQTAAFIAAAAHVLRPCGELLLAVPAALTRPGISTEYQQLLDSAVRCGLKPVAPKRGELRYLTPPFERAAMAAAGVPGVPDDWRRADIWPMLAEERRPLPDPDPVDDGWERHEIHQIPLLVRPDAPRRGDELIASLVAGDILGSVSARAPQRETAALWTSCNRAFGSSDPKALASLIGRINRREPVARHDSKAADMVLAIVATEREEHQLPPR